MLVRTSMENGIKWYYNETENTHETPFAVIGCGIDHFTKIEIDANALFDESARTNNKFDAIRRAIYSVYCNIANNQGNAGGCVRATGRRSVRCSQHGYK